MSGPPPYDAPPPLGSELESMDLHMLREWLDESFSDNEADADVSSSSDASSDSLLQLLQQQQQSAAAATAVLQQPSPAMYVTPNTGGASHSHSTTTNSAGTTGGAAAKRPRGSSEKRPRHAGQTTVAGTSRELAVLQDDDLLKKRSWPNQREELLYLRTKVCTLENELRELKIASRRQFSSASRITSADGVVGPNALVACISPGSLWEQVANRQLDEKVRAEVENRKLRGMVEAQIRLAKRLQQLLRKRQVRPHSHASMHFVGRVWESRALVRLHCNSPTGVTNHFHSAYTRSGTVSWTRSPSLRATSSPRSPRSTRSSRRRSTIGTRTWTRTLPSSRSTTLRTSSGKSQ